MTDNPGCITGLAPDLSAGGGTYSRGRNFREIKKDAKKFKLCYNDREPVVTT
jgi:hypothetical protein